MRARRVATLLWYDFYYDFGALDTVIRFCSVTVAAPQIFANSPNFAWLWISGRYAARACSNATGSAAQT